jgi:Cft2 family RNA processing exonuclease
VFAVVLSARVNRLNKNEKWAEKLSDQCGLSAAFLNDVLKELSESCFGDASTAKQVIEELTLSCHMDQEELRKFMEEVSKNCPADVEKLKETVLKANGDKEKLWKELSLWNQWIYRDSNR